VAQVEVLRGPQSTLFGKSASAGVINITSRVPPMSFRARRRHGDNDHEQRAQDR